MALSTHEILHLLERNAAVVRRFSSRATGVSEPPPGALSRRCLSWRSLS